MRDYYYLDEELFDKVEVEDIENKTEEEIKKERRFKKFAKAIKIMLHALLGSGAAMMTYQTSDAKDRDTKYLNRF